MNRCFECFSVFDDSFDVCPVCGTLVDKQPLEAIHLAPGTILEGRYLLGKAIGSGGFGIIYKAWDLKFETVIAVKEFFASRLMTRAQGESEVIVSRKVQDEFEYRKDRFLAEARNMAKFGTHKSIPNVFEYFEANGTAYIVMELLEGEPLNEYMKEIGLQQDVDFALFVTNEVGNALISLHESGIIHRDVSPDNIFISSGRELRVKLLDLGAAKLADVTDDVIDIILKPGYSPVEQYENTAKIGAWTDVYALGATLYVMLTGVKPEESTNRKIEDTVLSPREINPEIDENLSNAVMKAMAIERHLRFRSVADFLEAINGKRKVIPLAQEKKQRKLKRIIGIAAACLVLVGIGIGTFALYKDKQSVAVLPDASISVWVSVADGSTEETAVQNVVDDFTSKFENVSVDVKAIPAAEYADAIDAAAQEGTLPTLFESTDLSEDGLSLASDVSKILKTDQAKSCLFLDQYGDYYADTKKIPLAIEVPLAYIVTNGPVYIDYSKDTYKSVADFGEGIAIAIGSGYEDWLEPITKSKNLVSPSGFLDNSKNTCAVMISSSMDLDRVRSTLTNYQKTYAYYSASEIPCRFTYEWSIGNCSDDEFECAERLLSWMLGSSYQSSLMITACSDGQIPLNKDAFDLKIDQTYYTAIDGLYSKFVFSREG